MSNSESIWLESDSQVLAVGESMDQLIFDLKNYLSENSGVILDVKEDRIKLKNDVGVLFCNISIKGSGRTELTRLEKEQLKQIYTY